MSFIPAVTKIAPVIPGIIESILGGGAAAGGAVGVGGAAGAFQSKSGLIEGSKMSWDEITKMFNLPIDASYEQVKAAWQNRFKTLKGPGAVVQTGKAPSGIQTPGMWYDEVKKFLNKAITSTKGTGMFDYRYGPKQTGKIKNFKENIIYDPGFDQLLGDYGFTRGKTKAQDIWEKMRQDQQARDKLLEYIKGAQIEAKPLTIRTTTRTIGPYMPTQTQTQPVKTTDGGEDIPTDGQTKATPTTGGGTQAIPTVETKGGTKTDTTQSKTEPGEQTKTDIKTSTSTSTRTKTKTKTETETEDPYPDPYTDEDTDDDPDDKDKDKTKIREKPILTRAVKRRRKPVQWYPTYNFGGQSVLRLTDVEKLEELKDYTLFDLVNPILEGDQNNLLAIQNKIQESRRFYNTYNNIKAEPPLPPIKPLREFERPMKNIYDNRQLMRDDTPKARYYYDHYNDQTDNYLAYKMKVATQGHIMDPDLEQKINKNKIDFKGILPIDESELTPLDFKYY